MCAVVLTPLALFLDYLQGLSLIQQSISFHSLVEAGGRELSYEQVFGWTQVLWLSLGAWALLGQSTRAGFRTPTVIALAILLGLLLWVTEFRASVDSFTTLALAANLLPYIAMAGLLCHPAIRRRVLVWLIGYVVGVAAIVLGFTFATAFAAGTIGERASVFLFGQPTDTAMYLAGLLPLTFLLPRAAWSKVAICVLLVGLVLTQTRGAAAAAMLGFLAIPLIDPTIRLTRFQILIVVTMAVLIVGVFGSRPLPFSYDASTDYRASNVEQHFEYFAAQPLTGYGFAARSAEYFRAGDNTLLSLGNAGGIGAVALWIFAWCWPVWTAFVGAGRTRGTAVAVGVVAATFFSWMTTGSEVLIYIHPTNLLPLVLAVALAGVEMRRRITIAPPGNRLGSGR